MGEHVLGSSITENESEALDTMGAFDPTRQHLDLTKDEKRRTTALMMAIQAYKELIIRDADMYKAMAKDGRQFKDATIDRMVVAAMQFDAFIAGELAEQPTESPTNQPTE